MSLQVQTQTLQINKVPVDKLQVLIERARQTGTTPEEYALRLIVNGLETREQAGDQSSAPFPQQEAVKEQPTGPRVLTEWYGRLEDAERFPDLGYRLSQTDTARFDADWEMVIEAHQIKGEDIRESRLQRTVGGIKSREG